MIINLNAVAPRILGSRGTPSKFVLYALRDMYAKFGAFTRFVTIFVNFDANGLDYTVANLLISSSQLMSNRVSCMSALELIKSNNVVAFFFPSFFLYDNIIASRCRYRQKYKFHWML